MNNITLLGSIFLSNFVPINNSYYLIPSGENIVFDLKLDGLVITGSYDIEENNKIYNPFKDNDLQKGDIIKKVNDNLITSLDDFSYVINKNDINDVKLTLKRGNNEIERNLKVFYIDNVLKTGLFVKNDVFGVGTISYIDPNTNNYGALGHEVIDDISNEMIHSNNGTIYFENVIKINKGLNYKPGSKDSEVTLKNISGNIVNSNKYGIFGTYSRVYDKNMKMKVARIEEIKLGKAYIKTCLKGTKIEEFEINILKLNKNSLDKEKGLMFEIVDKRLLNEAGGVYSGMSGSPIIQDNKIIGVVTHVINSTINRGYALYIDTMLKNSTK